MKPLLAVAMAAFALALMNGAGLVWAQVVGPSEDVVGNVESNTGQDARTAVMEAESAGSTDHAEQRRITGGIVAGVGLVTMSGDVDVEAFGALDSPPAQGIEGLSVGGYLALQLTPSWGGRIEARYSQRGASASRANIALGPPSDDDDGNDAGGRYGFDFELAYIQVPLFVTYTVPYDGRFVPYLFAGPDIAVLLSSKVSGAGVTTDEMGTVVGEFSGERDVKDATASVDYALTLGAGMKFPLPSGRLVIDARYLISIADAVGEGETEFAEGILLRPQGLRHHGLLINAAYEF